MATPSQLPPPAWQPAASLPTKWSCEMSHYRYAIRQPALSTESSCVPSPASMFFHVLPCCCCRCNPLGMWAVGITRSVGKAATTSSHLLTTSARFCYTKCAEVCSRMRLSIRHVAHQNVVFIFRQPHSLSLSRSPIHLSVCLSACPFVFYFSGLLFGFLGDFY